MVHCCEIASF